MLRDTKEEAAEKEAENNRRKLENKERKPTHHRNKNHHHQDKETKEELEAKSKFSFTTKQTEENMSKKLGDDVSRDFLT